MEKGRIRGTRQQLPFYQEIEFLAPQQYRGLSQVELSFVADGSEMDVVMEMDKTPGLFTGGSDSYRVVPGGSDQLQPDRLDGLHQPVADGGRGRRNWL